MGDYTRLPADTLVSLHGFPQGAAGHRHAVVLSHPPREATPAAFAAALTARGGGAYMTLDAGVPWTDREVESLAAFLVGRRGIVMLGFARRADAVWCERWLTERRR
jgi:hypothetical protein